MESPQMFWGLVVKPEKRYEQLVEEPFHISKACIEPSNGKAGDVTSVYIEVENDEFLICNLQDKNMNESLDLNFNAGDKICFKSSGNGTVHLTGYNILEEMPDDTESFGEDDSDEEESEVENEAPQLVSKKRKRLSELDESKPSPKKKNNEMSPLDKLLADKKKESEKKDKKSAIDVTAAINKADEMRKKMAAAAEKRAKDNKKSNGQADEEDDDSDESDDEDFVLGAAEEADSDEDGGEESEDDGEEEEEGEEDDGESDEEGEDEEMEVESPPKKAKESPAKKLAPQNGTPKPSKNKAKAAVNGTPAGKKAVESTPKPAKKADDAASSPKKTPKPAKNGQVDVSPKKTPKQVDSTPDLKSTDASAKKKKNKKNKDSSTTSPDKGQPTPAKTPKRTLKGGLVVEDVKIGNGPEAKRNKVVGMYYEGKLKSNNKVFDSTKSGKPFKFRLGQGEVIKGWDIGLEGIKVGGKRKLTIPANLAYGASGAAPEIPPNATLVFEVECKAVH